jgi:hypothetical protein
MALLAKGKAKALARDASELVSGLGADTPVAPSDPVQTTAPRSAVAARLEMLEGLRANGLIEPDSYERKLAELRAEAGQRIESAQRSELGPDVDGEPGPVDPEHPMKRTL